MRNTFLELRNKLIPLDKWFGYGNEEPINDHNWLTDYHFSDGNWDGFWEHFRVGHPWGAYHPNDPKQYWSDQKASMITNEGLKLEVMYSPRNFFTGDLTISIPYLTGLVCSKPLFDGKTFFRIKCKLPLNGHNLWSAIWLYGETWPPEIDVVESYIKDGHAKHESNFHTGTYAYHDNWGAKQHKIRTMEDGFMTFSCYYDPGKQIDIYYNGYLVRTIRNKKQLNKFAHSRMQLVINSGIWDKLDSVIPDTFLIKSIEVYSKWK